MSLAEGRRYTLVGCKQDVVTEMFTTFRLLGNIREDDLTDAVENFFNHNSDLIAVGIWSETSRRWFGGIRRV